MLSRPALSARVDSDGHQQAGPAFKAAHQRFCRDEKARLDEACWWMRCFMEPGNRIAVRRGQRGSSEGFHLPLGDHVHVSIPPKMMRAQRKSLKQPSIGVRIFIAPS